MTLVQIIGLAIKASMFLIVFAIGLNATPKDFKYLLRHPALLVRSLLSMNVIMLVFAVGVVTTFNMHPAVKIALVALACSPVPPILPFKQLKAGGSDEYVIGLLSATAAAAIVIVPLAIEIIGHAFGLAIHVPASRIAVIVATTVLLPLTLGVLARSFAPAFVMRIARPVTFAATIVLLAAVLPLIVKSFPTFWALIGNGVVIFLVLFSLLGLAVGHLLGGPDPDNRTALALATATRHPAVALAIAGINFPDQKAVIAVVIWHLILSATVAAPYVNWRKKLHAAAMPLSRPAPAVPRSWGR
jgi:BASS family bile acid:Na+ symporter